MAPREKLLSNKNHGRKFQIRALYEVLSGIKVFHKQNGGINMRMESREYESLVMQARKTFETPERCYWIGEERPQVAKLELFSIRASICAQKVRSVLAEKGLTSFVYEMSVSTGRTADGDMVVPDVFHPDYVRLRLLGGKSLGFTLVKGYSGVTSVKKAGFDACVVPTLADHENGRVVVDSVRICQYIDHTYPGPISLWPDNSPITEAIGRQIDLVDQTPHGALLFGFHPDKDDRPEAVKAWSKTVLDDRLEVLEALIQQNQDEAPLVAAYRAKIVYDRESKVARFDADFQRSAREVAHGIVLQLEEGLARSSGPWLFGADFTMADLFWGISLIRMKYVGLAHLWRRSSRVVSYLERLCDRPSLRTEVIQATFQSLPPSEHMADLVR